jgi:hypothetical protein
MNYLLIDDVTGLVTNVIAYDGVSPYLPPPGQSIEPAPDGVWIGWTKIGGEFNPPAD